MEECKWIQELAFDEMLTADGCAAAAAATGRLLDVDVLLADDSDRPSRDLALIAAAANGHLPIVERLLADPLVDPSAAHPDAAVSHLDAEGRRLRRSVSWPGDAHPNEALRLAAAGGHSAVVERLLADPRVSPTDRSVSLPLNVAIRLGHVVVARRLLADPRLADCRLPHDALYDAASRGDAAMVSLLLADGRFNPRAASVTSARPSSLLAAAADAGHLAVVELLLADARVDPTAASNEALQCACRGGHDSVVTRLLADARVREHNDSETGAVLVAAARVGDVAFVSEQLDGMRRRAPTRFSSDGRICRLLEAATLAAGTGGQVEVLRLFVSHAFVSRVLARDRLARLLVCAAAGGSVATLDWLVAEQGDDPAHEACVTMYAAAKEGYVDVMRRLLQHYKLDPRASSWDVPAPLVAAAEHGSAAVVALLLEDKRVNVAQGAFGAEALSLAVKGRHAAIVAMLLADSRVDPTKSCIDSVIRDAAARAAAADRFAAMEGVTAANDRVNCAAVVDALLTDARVRRAVASDAELLGCIKSVEHLKLLVVDPTAALRPVIAKLLCRAARNGSVELLERLLRLCVPSELPSDAIYWAAEHAGAAGSAACCDVLLALPSTDVIRAVCCALREAASHHRVSLILRLLDDPRLEPSPLLQAVFSPCLLCACSRGDTTLLRRLLADARFAVPAARDEDDATRAGRVGARPAALYDATPAALHDAAAAAVSYGRVHALEMLLFDPRAAELPESTLHALFMDAAQLDRPWAGAAMCCLLAGVPGRACISSAGHCRSVLAAACQHSDIACVEALLADPRVRGDVAARPRYHAPVAHAAHREDLQLLRRLLADPLLDPMLKPDPDGHEGPQILAPLPVAAEHGHSAMLQVLLADPRVDPSAANEADGTTALHWAAASGKLGVLQRLLADPRVFADAADHRNLDALDAALGHTAFISASSILQDKSVRLRHRNVVGTQLLLDARLLHARLRREDGMRDVSRLGIDVAGLGQRAWMRRRAVIAARQRAMDGADDGSDAE